MDPDSFWTKTPQEASIIIDARWAYEAMQQNRMAWLAWHIAALMRQKMLPDLSRLLVGKQKPKPRQTWQDQMAIMGQWAIVMKSRKL